MKKVKTPESKLKIRQKEQEKFARMAKKQPKLRQGKYAKEKVLYEGNFIKNAISKTKNFLKTSYKGILKNAKKVFSQLKKDFLGSKKPSNFKPGKLIAFNYRAKDATKRFDKNPLVICLGPPKLRKLQKTHMFGLNIHWLPAKDRVAIASFFTELLAKRNGELVYDDVKPFISKFKGHPVLRMYIIKNIGQKVIEMPAEQYLTAASIPSEQWAGG